MLAVVFLPDRFFVIRPAPGPESRSTRQELWEGLRVLIGCLFFPLGIMFLLLILLAGLLG
jgi:hypothetical protein